MRYRRLGNSGLRVSRIALGDSERIVGGALRRYTKRDEIVLATKVFNKMGDRPGDSGLSRKAIMQQIDASLVRLGTDYVDLYQIQRFDPDTPVEETMEALHDVVKAGKARHPGASSMWAWQFAKLQHVAKGRLARPADAAPTARSSNDPVASAFFDDVDRDRPVIDAVQRIARERSVPMAPVALAWMPRNPVVTAPIIGATSRHHLQDAVAALEIGLTTDEVAALEAPYSPRAVEGFHSYLAAQPAR